MLTAEEARQLAEIGLGDNVLLQNVHEMIQNAAMTGKYEVQITIREDIPYSGDEIQLREELKQIKQRLETDGFRVGGNILTEYGYPDVIRHNMLIKWV